MRATSTSTRTAAACLALAFAGCGAGEDIRGGGAVPGSSMTITSMLPLRGPDAAAVRDIVAGEKLALFEAGGEIRRLRVGMAVLDEGRRNPSAVARTAIEDIQVAAVIGGLSSRAAARAAPIANAAGVLHVSPGAADPELIGDPRLEVSGQRTLFMLAPDATVQAEAMVEQALPGDVTIEAEPGRDPAALAEALRDAAGPRAAGDRARTVLYAGGDVESAAEAAEDLARGRPRARIVFGDALARRGLRERLSPRARRIARFVAAVPQEPPADFAAAFRERFGREPGPYAFLGHVAMTRVLDAIRDAAPKSAYRQRIIDAYAAAGGDQPAGPYVWR